MAVAAAFIEHITVQCDPVRVEVGLGLRTKEALDLRAELWFCSVIWVLALVGALLASTMWSATLTGNVTGGQVALGLVLGTLVLNIVWSAVHHPRIKILETEMHPGLPTVLLVIALIAAIVVAISGSTL